MLALAFWTALLAGTSPRQEELSTPEIYESAVGSVAHIRVLRGEQVVSTGTGFVIGQERIATNWHVAAAGELVTVEIPHQEPLNATKVFAYSADDDLAVLVVPGLQAPPLALDSELPRVGTKVVVVGSPLGLASTVSEGIVSAVREIDSRRRIQITAAVSPGSSGSPALDASGRVIGVVSSSHSAGQLVNVCVPAHALAEVNSTPMLQDFATWAMEQVTSAERSEADATFALLLGLIRQYLGEIANGDGLLDASTSADSLELLKGRSTLPRPTLVPRGKNWQGLDPTGVTVMTGITLGYISNVRLRQLRDLCETGLQADPCHPELVRLSQYLGDTNSLGIDTSWERNRAQALLKLVECGIAEDAEVYQLTRLVWDSPRPRTVRRADGWIGPLPSAFILELVDRLEQSADSRWRTTFSPELAETRAWGLIAKACEQEAKGHFTSYTSPIKDPAGLDLLRKAEELNLLYQEQLRERFIRLQDDHFAPVQIGGVLRYVNPQLETIFLLQADYVSVGIIHDRAADLEIATLREELEDEGLAGSATSLLQLATYKLVDAAKMYEKAGDNEGARDRVNRIHELFREVRSHRSLNKESRTAIDRIEEMAVQSLQEIPVGG